MSTGKEKRRTGIAAKLLTSTLLAMTLVAIVVAGTHPRGSVITDNENSRMCVNTLDPVAGLSHEQQKDVTNEAVPPQPPAPSQAVNLPQPMNPPQSRPRQIRRNQRRHLHPRMSPHRRTAHAPTQPANPPQPPAKVQPAAPPAKPATIQEKSEKPGKQEIRKGGLIEAPRPIYPQEAKDKKVEGQVTVSIVIGEEGTVSSARPTSGPDLLQGAAKEAALKARFHPTIVNGKPAKVAGSMTYN